MNDPDWLPDLVLLENSGGDWGVYLETIYEHFREDFVYGKPIYRGRELGLKRYPLSKGKEATFWHFISEGEEEDERIPDLRRCERIRWPSPIIDHSTDPGLKVWQNKRRGETRICIWLEKEEYIVILAKRSRYILPWTAYMVTRSHQKRKLQREYEDYWRDRP